MSNYAYENSLYTFGDNLKNITSNLRNSFDRVSHWFYKNYMVLNAGKCHFMCLGNNTETFSFSNNLMENSNEQKILGLIIDNNLNFKDHMTELCKKASQKIEALCRLPSYLRNSQKKVIFNSIIKTQCNYCPLVWMFCSRTLNDMINKSHEKEIRIVLNDYSSDFIELLENNNDISNHHTLLIEVFNMKNERVPSIMESMLKGVSISLT